MRDHEQRVVDELAALNDKKDKLKAFIDDENKFKKLDTVDAALLLEQYTVMEQYSAILQKRIEKFLSK